MAVARRAEFLVCRRELPRMRLPNLVPAAPIEVQFLPDLTRRGGKLQSGGTGGVEVHAGSFLRERRIVLESALFEQRAELRRILIHELFHFVWMRLGNPARVSWETILAVEFDGRARGELGWSAEWRKADLPPEARRKRGIAWREYACESFCDSAAWHYAGLADHDEFTLGMKWRMRRRGFLELLEQWPLAL